MLGERRRPPVPWPSTAFALGDPRKRKGAKWTPNPLSDHMLARLNEGSGPYQMVNVLGDCIVLGCDTGRTTLNATYFEDMPIDRCHARYRGSPRLTVSFGYGGEEGQRQNLATSTKGTNFFGFVYYFPGECSRDWRGDPAPDDGPEQRRLLTLPEQHSTQWTSGTPIWHLMLQKFVQGSAFSALARGGWQDSQAVTGLSRSGKSQPNDDGKKASFAPGNVDLWVRNLAGIPVKLVQGGQKWMEPDRPGGREHYVTTWNKREVDRGEVPVVETDGGARLETKHLARWRAVDPKTRRVLGEIEVDVAKGIVQDFIVHDVQAKPRSRKRAEL